MGADSSILNVAFNAPLGQMVSVIDFSVVSVIDQAVFAINSVSLDPADNKVLVLTMSQKLSSGGYTFEAKNITLESKSQVPLTVKNKANFTLVVPEICGDKGDNDGNGKTDCLDEACSADPSCIVGICEVHADCLDNPGPDDPFIYCVSVDGGAAQCMLAESFSSACPENPTPLVYSNQQPVFIDCTSVTQ